MYRALSLPMMDSGHDKDPVGFDVERREREFDIVTLVLAGILALIILGAVGYGVLNTSQVGETVPMPDGVHRAAIKAVTQPVTEGSAGPHREAGKTP
jgi:hypothetical protein